MKFIEHLAEMMKDPEFATAYRELDAPFQAGNLLIRVRSELNLTQQQLAERAGVKREYIARIENGDANPTIKSLARLLNGAGYRLVLSAERTDEAAPARSIAPNRKRRVAV